MKYFITGTDTGVGKTFVTILLAKHFTSQGLKTGVIKPIETGIGNNPSPDFKLIAKAIDDKIKSIYNFKEPLAPYIASSLENIDIDISKIVKFIHNDILENSYQVYLVEGAGGLLVPLTSDKLIIDLIKALQFEVILVSRSNLGTVNHTLLSIEALKTRGIKIKEVILNEVVPTSDSEISQNINMIEKFSGIKVRNIIRHTNLNIEEILKNKKSRIIWD